MRRTSVRRGLAAAVVTAAGLLALSGCQLIGKDDAAGSAPTPAPSSSTPAGAKAHPSGKSTAKNTADGTLPDVCQLFTRAEVAGLSGGHQVTQVDKDGAGADATTRHCQWQMNDARLAVFLSRTTGSDFRAAHGNARKVTGIGDDAASDSGHLYVLADTVEIDVYAVVGGAEAPAVAKNTAQKVIEKL